MAHKTVPAIWREFRAWYRRVIRNRCIDEWRRRKRAPQQLDWEIPGPQKKETGDLLDLVWPALQLLPDRHRQVLELTFYADKSSREIGATMGLREGTVNVLRLRALKKLKDLLENPNGHQ
jgi:RNA polymerase sigma-70 factor (ECF subfamily)